jgi:hypothetical protein
VAETQSHKQHSLAGILVLRYSVIIHYYAAVRTTSFPSCLAELRGIHLLTTTTCPMARLAHLFGLAFSLSTLCIALSTGDGRSRILQGRRLKSNGLPSVDNFLSRAYHSGGRINRMHAGSAADNLQPLFSTTTSTLTEGKSAFWRREGSPTFHASHDLTAQSSVKTLTTGQ